MGEREVPLEHSGSREEALAYSVQASNPFRVLVTVGKPSLLSPRCLLSPSQALHHLWLSIKHTENPPPSVVIAVQV